MPAGFQATDRLLSNPGELGQLLLRKSQGLSLADDVAGNRRPDELEGRNVALDVRFGQRWEALPSRLAARPVRFIPTG